MSSESNIGIDPNNYIVRPDNPNIKTVSTSLNTEGVKITTFKLRDPELAGQGDSVIFLPGIRNPQSGEFGEDFVAQVLNSGASCVQCLQYSYIKPLDVNNVLGMLCDSIQNSPVPVKLVGISLLN